MDENITFSKTITDYRNSNMDSLKIQYLVDGIQMNFIFDLFAIDKLGLDNASSDEEIIKRTSSIISEQADNIKQMYKPGFDIKMVVNKVEGVCLTDIGAHNFTHSNTNDLIRGISKSKKNGKQGRFFMKKDELVIFNDGKAMFSSMDKPSNKKRTFVSSDKLPIVIDEDVFKKMNMRIVFDYKDTTK